MVLRIMAELRLSGGPLSTLAFLLGLMIGFIPALFSSL
jgi:hypothetical protein